MSESISNGESYSSGNNKYASSNSWASESHSESFSRSPAYSPSKVNQNNIDKAKLILKNTEKLFIDNAHEQNIHNKNELMINVLRSVMLENEDALILTPNFQTLLDGFNVKYNTFSELEKADPIYDLMLNVLNQQVSNEKKSTSKLRYW